MPAVEVSWGELVDKLTILEIKERRLSSSAAVANVRRELAALNEALHALRPPAAFADLKQGLAAINEILWEIEDRIRAKEAAGSLTGDESLKNEGRADQAKHDVKDAVDTVADKAKDLLDRDK